MSLHTKLDGDRLRTSAQAMTQSLQGVLIPDSVKTGATSFKRVGPPVKFQASGLTGLKLYDIGIYRRILC